MQANQFSPWRDAPERSCWTCAHATGYDGVHLWCRQHRLVVLTPCGWWERGQGVINPIAISPKSRNKKARIRRASCE